MGKTSYPQVRCHICGQDVLHRRSFPARSGSLDRGLRHSFCSSNSQRTYGLIISGGHSHFVLTPALVSCWEGRQLAASAGVHVT
eukprot:jgi/Botrbrau1/7520/Bobra.0019s0011.1